MSLTQIALYLSIAIGVAVALFGLDRLGLWMEHRGWIYYRRRKPSGASVGNALMELQSLIAPQARDVIEAERQKDAQDQGEWGELLRLEEGKSSDGKGAEDQDNWDKAPHPRDAED